MKNAFTLKTNWCITFLFCSIFLFGQEHSLNFEVKQGFTNFKNLKRDYSSYENFNVLGGDFSIGLNYQYSFFPKKYFSGSVGILWNHYSFARRTISETSYWINAPSFYPYGGYERTYYFDSYSIRFPVCAKTQIWKIGFSFGLSPRYHLKTKMLLEELHELKNVPNGYDTFSNIYVAGETIEDSLLNQGKRERAFLNEKIDMQLQVGIAFFLSEKISLELEYRKLMYGNDFIVDSETYQGLWNRYIKKYEFSLPTVSIGINYRVF